MDAFVEGMTNRSQASHACLAINNMFLVDMWAANACHLDASLVCRSYTLE